MLKHHILKLTPEIKKQTSTFIVFLPQIPPGEDDISVIYKEHAFNIFINCKFVYFAVPIMHEFVSSLPMSYEKPFQFYDFYDNEFKAKFQNNINDLAI